MNNEYDVIIIGGGPAGITAGIYALRSGCKVAIIEKNMIGGQVNYTYEVDNYPGLPKINGFELIMKFNEHYEGLGGETLYGEIENLDLVNKTLTLNGEEYACKSIILAMGAKARPLGVEKEKELTGRGVAYCAICDGNFYRDKDVVLVGGGNTAVEDALYLSNIVKSLVIVNNMPKFNAQQVLCKELEKAQNSKDIKVLHNSTIKALNGEDKVAGVVVNNNGTEVEFDCQGVFVAIGRIPDTECVKGLVDTDKYGYIIADENMHTSTPGVFVCGDVRVKNLRQIATAVGDGAIAGTECAMYVNAQK